MNSVSMAATEPIEFDIFLGDASPAEARLYLRASGEAVQAAVASAATGAVPRWQLTGEVEGPYCRLAATLSASVRWRDQSDAAGPLAQVLVPDPCFWTPELPYLYQVRAELHCHGRRIAECQRTVGLRPWGVRGRRFVFAGQQWVLRGAQRSRSPDAPLDDWHQSGTSMWVHEPHDELCDAASRHGVLVCAEVHGNGAEILRQLQRLARHAAVGLVLLEPNCPADQVPARSVLRRVAPNLLLAVGIDGADVGQAANPSELLWPEWAQVAVVRDCDLARLAHLASICPLPVIAQQLSPAAEEQSSSASLACGRAACDLLQRHLAGSGEYAGYMT